MKKKRSLTPKQRGDLQKSIEKEDNSDDELKKEQSSIIEDNNLFKLIRSNKKQIIKNIYK
jgi:hypothetical protein